jgi:hypothetical protein
MVWTVMVWWSIVMAQAGTQAGSKEALFIRDWGEKDGYCRYYITRFFSVPEWKTKKIF